MTQIKYGVHYVSFMNDPKPLNQVFIIRSTNHDSTNQGSLLGLTLTHMEVKNVRLCSES